MNPTCRGTVATAVLLALSLLVGCGNKGALVLAPTPAAVVPEPAPPPATDPTDAGSEPEIPPPPAADPASTPPPVPGDPGPDPDGDG